MVGRNVLFAKRRNVQHDVVSSDGARLSRRRPTWCANYSCLWMEVEKALDTRTSMGVIGDLNRFQQFQMGKAMTEAASNPAGGGASDGLGLGLGFAMANQMFNPAGQQAPGGRAVG